MAELSRNRIMSDFDAKAFADKVAGLFDDQLIALLSINASSYTEEALNIARKEAERRGITGDVQKVHFDVFLNSAGFAGRLILLEEQLMFLSTGMRAAAGGIGLIGAIAGEARVAERNVAAARLDFAALDNEGSWIYFLDQINECRAASRMISGSELQFEIAEEDGSILNGVVNCGDLSSPDVELLVRQILAARANLAKST
ncbi:MAG: hypothetical protein ABL984_05635 [Pyrinomonadaceae bacterium]